MNLNIQASCFSILFFSLFLSTTSILIASSISDEQISPISTSDTVSVSSNSSFSLSRAGTPKPVLHPGIFLITTTNLTNSRYVPSPIGQIHLDLKAIEQESLQKLWLPWNTKMLINIEELYKFSKLPPLVKTSYWCSGQYMSEHDKKSFSYAYTRPWKPLTSKEVSTWPNN